MTTEPLAEKARHLLDANARRGKGYYYTAPSPKKYPHQWSWDSSFHAIVNCRLGRPNLAREEILTLLQNMSPEGVLPHIIFHGRGLRNLTEQLLRSYWPRPGRSPLVQPPVAALAVKEIWESTEDSTFLHEALPFLERHFNWLEASRRFGRSPLVSIISPWESGLDHKPVFDEVLGRVVNLPLGRYIALYTMELRLARHKYDSKEVLKRGYFNVREVLFNTIYALGMDALGEMLKATGELSKADLFRNRGRDVGKAILEECYDNATGLYYDIDVNNNSFIGQPSISSLMPLALSNVPRSRLEAMIRHLTDTSEFWLPFPVPSVPRNGRHFEPQNQRYLWRGPTWINTNWLLVNGLKKHGYPELADAIAESSRKLVAQSGFREYYNPLTGEGGGEKDFGWSTLAAIM
ncbi:MAG: trehalase family glycosidase [Dehalococcoidia bacterium]